MSDFEISLEESFSSVAHQWRQPLSEINSLVGSIDNRLYELGVDDEVISAKLFEIEKLTQNMSKVIDDFRFRATKEKNRNLEIIIKEVLESLSYALREKKIELLLEVDASLKFFKDDKLLKQVLVTLIDNARDALVERNVYKPMIRVSAYEERGYLFIKVCDNAGGISKNLMGKIFEVGFSTKHSSEGTGLGLYMCKKLLSEKLNAQLDVKNVDSGVCFIITLTGD